MKNMRLHKIRFDIEYDWYRESSEYADATESLQKETGNWWLQRSIGIMIFVSNQGGQRGIFLPEWCMKLGEKISTKRKQNNMTQEQLADYLGVSRQAISKWESDGAYPETEKLIKMSELFDCTLDYLLKESIEAEENMESYTKEGTHGNGKTWSVSYSGPKIRERQSKKMVGGKPLWQIGKKADAIIALGMNAKGVIAIGITAKGILSLGLFSMGLFSMGVFSLGILSIGLFSLGLFAAGSVAVGVIAVGAISLGIFSLGALAVGDFSVGALAIGKYGAIGDHAQGMIALGDTQVKGSTYEYLGEYGQAEISMVKNLLDEHVPTFFSWFKNIFVMFL